MKRKISACALLFTLEFVDIASAKIISGPGVAIVETEEVGSSSVEDIYDGENLSRKGDLVAVLEWVKDKERIRQENSQEQLRTP